MHFGFHFFVTTRTFKFGNFISQIVTINLILLHKIIIHHSLWNHCRTHLYVYLHEGQVKFHMMIMCFDSWFNSSMNIHVHPYSLKFIHHSLFFTKIHIWKVTSIFFLGWWALWKGLKKLPWFSYPSQNQCVIQQITFSLSNTKLGVWPYILGS